MKKIQCCLKMVGMIIEIIIWGGALFHNIKGIILQYVIIKLLHIVSQGIDADTDIIECQLIGM